MTLKYIKTILLFHLIGIVVVQSQNNKSLDIYFKELKFNNFENAKKVAANLDSDKKEQLIVLAQLLSFNNQLNIESIDKLLGNLPTNFSNKDPFNLTLSHLINGYYKMSSASTRVDVFSNFNLALQNAKQTKYEPLVKLTLLAIIKLYRLGLLQNDISFEIYLNEYHNLCEDGIDFFQYYSNQLNLFSQTEIYGNENEKNQTLFNDIIYKLDSLKPKIHEYDFYLIDYYTDKGNHIFTTNPEKAKDYYQKGINLCDTTLYFNPHRFNLLLHIARAEEKSKNYKEALNLVHKSEKFKSKSNEVKDNFYVAAYKAEYYGKLKIFDSAYHYIRESRYLEYELDFQNQNSQISKLEIELGTAEKEKENLILKDQKTKNRNIAIALAGFVLFSSITFLLIQKNTKRKQLLAVQEKELETQKLTAVLKEQELASIDAMIKGQEIERQRIANDLHDDLGGLMTTVKWHFNALKEKQSPELYSKATELLDEAYDKIRSIAHVKNSGVLAKKGLLKAINDMANTISKSNKLHIEVIDYGMNHRLENSLELTIFRIIQELTTNIIKHAEASEATIHITNHDDSLNIMVEDNGKGFNPKNIVQSSGMGIHSIDKRVENLGGTITIESELNKGTTIIIDIRS